MSLRAVLVVAALAALVVAALPAVHLPKVRRDPKEVLLTPEFVEETNRKAGGLWTARIENGPHAHAGTTREEAMSLLGVKRRSGKSPLPRKTFTAEELAAIPASFDAATQWPDCPTITHIRDQSACGSCWAVAAAEAMSDRYCVGGGQKDLLISAANLLACCWYCGSGCEGGDPAFAWSWWTSNGLMSDACDPYPFPPCDHHTKKGPYPECPSTTYATPVCNNTCTGGAAPVYYKGTKSYSLSGEAAFQAELMANGPFEVAFSVYSDFLTYSGGVYKRTSNDYLGGHAVKLVGWGTLNGTPYWKINNSWNDSWGIDGYFLILRGQDECGIEDEGSAGMAQV